MHRTPGGQVVVTRWGSRPSSETPATSSEPGCGWPAMSGCPRPPKSSAGNRWLFRNNGCCKRRGVGTGSSSSIGNPNFGEGCQAPSIQQMRADLAAGKVSGLVATKLDRLWRNLYVAVVEVDFLCSSVTAI